MNVQQRFWGLVAGIFLALGVGCGGGDGLELYGVTGKVTYDGEPVSNGSISFEPAAGTTGPASGSGLAEDGTYEVPDEKGLVPGTYNVRITGNRKTGRQVPAGPPTPPGSMVDEVAQYIPAQYNTKTTLTVQIEKGKNEHDFKLVSNQK